MKNKLLRNGSNRLTTPSNLDDTDFTLQVMFGDDIIYIKRILIVFSDNITVVVLQPGRADRRHSVRLRSPRSQQGHTEAGGGRSRT